MAALHMGHLRGKGKEKQKKTQKIPVHVGARSSRAWNVHNDKARPCGGVWLVYL